MLGLVIISVVGGFHDLDITWSDGNGPSELSLGFGLAPPFPKGAIFAGLVRAFVNCLLAGSLFWLWSRHIPAQA